MGPVLGPDRSWASPATPPLVTPRKRRVPPLVLLRLNPLTHEARSIDYEMWCLSEAPIRLCGCSSFCLAIQTFPALSKQQSLPTPLCFTFTRVRTVRIPLRTALTLGRIHYYLCSASPAGSLARRTLMQNPKLGRSTVFWWNF